MSASDADVHMQGEHEGQPSTGDGVIIDERLWFSDGNIVVRAGPGCTGSGPVHAFKCHKSVLATKSPILKTMFELPNEAGERMQGIPTVDFPDKWEDVRDFLLLIYSSLPLPVAVRDLKTTAIVAGPLRLAVKYEVMDLAALLTGIFEREWPNDYEQWISRERETDAIFKAYPAEIPFFDINDYVPDAAPAVQLARELRLTKVLRCAYYDLFRSRSSRIPPWEAIGHPVNADGYEFQRIADVSLLDRDELARFVVGRERMAFAIEAKVFDNITDFLSRKKCPGCRKRTEANESWPCREPLQAWWHATDWAPRMYDDPLARLLKLHDDDNLYPLSKVSQACDSCRSSLRLRLRQWSEDLWELLPKIFDFQVDDV